MYCMSADIQCVCFHYCSQNINFAEVGILLSGIVMRHRRAEPWADKVENALHRG